MIAFGERKVRANNQLDLPTRLAGVHGCHTQTDGHTDKRTDVRTITIASTDTSVGQKSSTFGEMRFNPQSPNENAWSLPCTSQIDFDQYYTHRAYPLAGMLER